MIKLPETRKLRIVAASVLAPWLLMVNEAHAGGYIFSNAPQLNGTRLPSDLITHPTGYTGTGGTLDLNVCIVPGSPNASDMEQSIKNNIAVWNKGRSTTSNLRFLLQGAEIDFESVALHEMGHCIGLSHPNQATESGLPSSQQDYTKTTAGPNNVFDVAPGADGIIGSPDDIRGDDVNMHWFYSGTNNPFSEQAIVDSTTYTQSLAGLPMGDTYVSNADRTVSGLARYSAPNTEASMQQGSFFGELQRTVGHDDVSTVRFAASGLDEIQGTADDYQINLTYGGISASNCDINVSMDASRTGFAVCFAGGSFINSRHVRMTSANMFFNPNINWFYNNSPPCNESIALTPAVWKMVSLPCKVGVSTSAALIDVFGDDLGTTNYNVDWVVFEYEYTDQGGGLLGGAYRMLALSDELDSTKGYWIITNESGKTIDVQGEYHSEMDADLFIDAAANQTYGWNMVGMPFRFPVTWGDALVIDPIGDVLTLQEADPIVSGGVVGSGSGTACSDGPAPTPDCKVAQFAFKYDTTALAYETLSTTSGTLDEWDAAWVFAGDTGYSLRLPMPTQERTTP